jgi:hypothetical protein
VNGRLAAEERRAAFVARRPMLPTLLLIAFCFLVYAVVADRVLQGTELSARLIEAWAFADDPAALAGQWFSALLLLLLHAIPNSGPQTLLLVTVSTGACLMGALHWRLMGRGWPVMGGTLVVLAVALNPVMLILVTSGSTLLLAAIMMALVGMAFDRASSVGDSQSLIALGLALAGMIMTTPTAIYILAPMLVLLPLALREVRDGASAIALFLLTLFPTVVALGGILVAAATLGEPPKFAFLRWSAAMHGGDAAAQVPWLAEHGGAFWAPLGLLMAWMVAAVPLSALPLLLVIGTAAERARPAFALMALLVAPVAGALATWRWHIADPLWAAAAGFAFSLGWLASRVLRPWERFLALMFLILGLVLAWSPLWMWDDELRLAWRAALFW